jgi:two-component system, NtrC family, response regulator AtoC
MPVPTPYSLDPEHLVALSKGLIPDIDFDRPISLKELKRQATRELERKIILKVLEAHGWNRKQAARALGISYRGLLYKIKEAGL